MVQIKAYRGSEIRRFDIEAGTTFDQLRELVGNLFGINKEDTIALNYCDRDGDIISMSSDGELKTALKHLGEQDTWKLQVVVEQRKREAQRQPSKRGEPASWWDWNPFLIHFAIREPPRRSLLDSLWDDNFLELGYLPFLRQHKLRLEEERKKAEAARCHAKCQASADAKHASDEVQAKASGEVAEKKDENHVSTTDGPVGYEEEKVQSEKEPTKVES